MAVWVPPRSCIATMLVSTRGTVTLQNQQPAEARDGGQRRRQLEQHGRVVLVLPMAPGAGLNCRSRARPRRRRGRDGHQIGAGNAFLAAIDKDVPPPDRPLIVAIANIPPVSRTRAPAHVIVDVDTGEVGDKGRPALPVGQAAGPTDLARVGGAAVGHGPHAELELHGRLGPGVGRLEVVAAAPCLARGAVDGEDEARVGPLDAVRVVGFVGQGGEGVGVVVGVEDGPAVVEVVGRRLLLVGAEQFLEAGKRMRTQRLPSLVSLWHPSPS